jgi:hypothetical protein
LTSEFYILLCFADVFNLFHGLLCQRMNKGLDVHVGLNFSLLHWLKFFIHFLEKEEHEMFDWILFTLDSVIVLMFDLWSSFRCCIWIIYARLICVNILVLPNFRFPSMALFIFLCFFRGFQFGPPSCIYLFIFFNNVFLSLAVYRIELCISFILFKISKNDIYVLKSWSKKWWRKY